MLFCALLFVFCWLFGKDAAAAPRCVPILETSTAGVSLILTFLLNITEISFFDVVCWFAREDLGVIVLPFEEIDCVMLFKLDVDERPI